MPVINTCLMQCAVKGELLPQWLKVAIHVSLLYWNPVEWLMMYALSPTYRLW